MHKKTNKCIKWMKNTKDYPDYLRWNCSDKTKIYFTGHRLAQHVWRHVVNVITRLPTLRVKYDGGSIMI